MPTEFSDETLQWRDNLRAFLEDFRESSPLSTGADFEAFDDEKRRVTGGALMQFLRFIQEDTLFEHFPILEKSPIDERVFVFATDAPGVVAAHDIIDADSERALVVTKHEWRAFVDAPATDDDPTYEHHYQYWSVWHRDFQADWNLPDEEPGEFWVHEEGFALADRAGRGSRHLWTWDGGELELFEQDVDTWTSSPEEPG
ncbi:MAG: hypothetical protein ABEN55_02110 [Bradymonadaceae bacterium]